MTRRYRLASAATGVYAAVLAPVPVPVVQPDGSSVPTSSATSQNHPSTTTAAMKSSGSEAVDATPTRGAGATDMGDSGSGSGSTAWPLTVILCGPEVVVQAPVNQESRSSAMDHPDAAPSSSALFAVGTRWYVWVEPL